MKEPVKKERIVCPECRTAFRLTKKQVNDNEGIVCPCGWRGGYWIDLGNGFMMSRNPAKKTEKTEKTAKK